MIAEIETHGYRLVSWFAIKRRARRSRRKIVLGEQTIVVVARAMGALGHVEVEPSGILQLER